MSLNQIKLGFFFGSLIACLLSSCTRPPYNNFEPRSRIAHGAVVGGTMGAAVGGAAAGNVPGALAGAALGGTLGAIVNTGVGPKNTIIKELSKRNIQFVQYGDTMTLIVPTDKYYLFNSPRLNEVCYPGLQNIIDLIRLYPHSPVYVAGFTDNVGTERHRNRLSEAQAETMLSFLWAHGVNAHRLKAEGYGDKNTVADNALIHGSAMNRRIEIQWFIGKAPRCCISKSNFAMK